MTAQRGDFDRPFTDRTDATDAEFEARLERLDRLEVADVGADAALQRVLALADELDATPQNKNALISRVWAARRIRAALKPPPPDGGDVR